MNNYTFVINYFNSFGYFHVIFYITSFKLIKHKPASLFINNTINIKSIITMVKVKNSIY